MFRYIYVFVIVSERYNSPSWDEKTRPLPYGTDANTRMKNKLTMIYGLSLYGLYIVAYPIAAIDERYALLLVLVGGFAGGIAAGFIWTAQGAYFAQTSQLYAKLSGITQEESSNKACSIHTYDP